MPTSVFDSRQLFSKLRFKHLQLLVELSKQGSLRAAAQALHLTQPALSKALAEVESMFDAPLFIRYARGVVPTEQGKVVVQGAAMLLEELSHLGKEVSQQQASVLRIGAPPFVAQGYLPSVLTALSAHAPSARVQLVEERVPLLVVHLLEGRLDALISSYPTELPEASGQPIHYEKLYDTGFTVIAPSSHPAASKKVNNWEELARHDWILPVRSSMLRRMMEDVFRKAGVKAPVPVIESTSPFTNMQLVRAGLGISAVPRSTLAITPRYKEVKEVRIEREIEEGPVALITRADITNPRVKILREAIALAHH